ncbi:hypothetical protein BG004_001249 [Podila humilis]|nr:hypothetical protein BG004_001249 [Podila humilis]
MPFSSSIDTTPQPLVISSPDRVVFRAIPQTLAPTNKRVTLSLRRSPSPSSSTSVATISTPASSSESEIAPANTQIPNSHRKRTTVAPLDSNDCFPISTTSRRLIRPKIIVTDTYPEQQRPSLSPSSKTSPAMKPVTLGKNGLPLKSALKSPSCSNPNSAATSPLRPSTIRSYSSPCILTSPKYVHFNTQLEHVRLFLQGETPSCVSERETIVDTRQDGSSTSSIQITLPNWSPAAAGTFKPVDIDTGALPLRVESVALSQDQTELKGKVLIQNIAFHKHVSVRFTTDFWQTQSEVNAEFQESIPGSSLDRFAFVIPLNMDKTKVEQSFCFAVRYQVIGREFWDSNNGMNYQVECKRVVVVVVPSQNGNDLLSKQRNSILLASRIPDYSKPIPMLKKKSSPSRYDLSTSLSAAYSQPSPVKSAYVPASQTAYRPSEYISPVQSPPGYHAQSLYASSPKFTSSYLSAVSPPEHIHLGFESLSLDMALPGHNNNSKRGTRQSWAPRESEQQQQLPLNVTRSQSCPPSNESTTAKPISIPSLNGGRPAVGSSSFRDLVDRYCFYESSPHTSPYSSYPNSPPATCIG